MLKAADRVIMRIILLDPQIEWRTRSRMGRNSHLQLGFRAIQSRWKRVVTLLLLIALTIMFVVRGFVPAFTRIDSDFPSYFTAAKIVADGQSADRLYDVSWFQEQMQFYHIGKPEAGKFSPFPPPTALLLLPLTNLEPLSALRVVTVGSILCLLLAASVLARILSWSYLETITFILLSGSAVWNSLRLGQPYIVVSASCILGYYARLRGAPVLAGLCFGLFVPIKYFPVVILIYFACCREWRIVLGGAAAALAVTAVSIAMLGWKVHEVFLSSVLGNHLLAHLSMQDPFAVSFQSFDTLFRRLLVFDAAANPHPWLASSRLQVAGVLIAKTTCLFIAIGTLVRIARSSDVIDKAALSVGMLGILSLLLAPATATYHFALLWLPVGLLISHFYREHALYYAYWMLGLYALIGLFPYWSAYRFDGRGGLTVLAYPRLYLLVAMLMICVSFVWRPRRIRDATTGRAA
jgi:Glycosyltransferase family 87